MKFFTILMSVTLLLSGNSELADIISPSGGMHYIQENKNIVTAFYQAIEENDPHKLKTILSPQYKVIDASTPFTSDYSKHDAMSKKLSVRVRALHEAFPDLSVHPIAMLTEGNNVFAKVTMTGIQKGNFLGVTPTNKPVTIKTFAIFTIEDGRIAMIQEMWNELSVMKQIGYFAV